MENGRFKSSTGFELSYIKITGKEPYITYIHGAHSSKNASKAQFLKKFAISKGYGFFACDLTGHGESEGDFEKDGTISLWKKDLHSALKFLNQNTITIASSMGFWLLSLNISEFKNQIKGVVGVSIAPDFTVDFNNACINNPELITKTDDAIKIKSSDGFEHKFMKKLLEDGSLNTVLDKTIDYQGKVVLLHGDNDAWVDWKKAIKTKDIILSDEVKVVIVKGGEHRMSEIPQLSILQKELEDMLK